MFALIQKFCYSSIQAIFVSCPIPKDKRFLYEYDTLGGVRPETQRENDA